MKKILYLIVALPLFLQSCLVDNDDVFDKTAAERLQEMIEEYNAALLDAPNGWMLQYFPHETQDYGGYTYFVSFSSDGNVTGMFELLNDPTISETSQFIIRSEQGPVLTFSTYNWILHFFCEPWPTGYRALGGDFEFAMMGISGDRIKLKGKTSGNTMYLTKLPAGYDKSQAILELQDMAENTLVNSYTMTVNGKAVYDIDIYAQLPGYNLWARRFDILETDSKDEIAIRAPYVVTTTGISFYEPVTVFGVEMQNFRYDYNTNSLVCTDGVNAVIKLS